MLPDEPAFSRILESGLRAPSAENRHYLGISLRAQGLELLTTDAPTWPTQPHRRMLAWLSYGAVVENMALTSAALGWNLAVSLTPDPSRPTLIAVLDWQALPEPAAADRLEQSIAGRHTNRRFYRKAPLGPAVLADLSAAAASVAGAQLAWLDAGPDRARALQAIRIAEAERFVGARLHRELLDAIRFDAGWRGTADEGLPLASLEVEWPMRLPFALMRRAALMRLGARLGVHHLLGLRSGYFPAASAPHLGLLLAADRGDAATFAAGRAFERLWLAAASHGLALQPLGAPTALARQLPGDGWVRPRVQARLQALLQAMGTGRPGEPLLLFRLGRAGPAGAVTGRQPWHTYRVD